jgi:pimeloyl-ACP methyl ester carboxylesterase
MKPTFLFVHGFGSDGDSWRLQVQALSPRFGTVTLDLPGHGQSPLPSVHSLESLACAVVQAKSRCDDPVILVGHSMGCRVALDAFRQSPVGVAGIALIDGSATGREHAPRLLQLLRDRLRSQGMLALLRENAEGMFTLHSPAQFRVEAIAKAVCLDTAFAENMLKDLAQWDAVEALQPIVRARIPVLGIQATTLGADMHRRSLVLGETSEWGALLRRLIPHAHMHDIEGIGHFAQLEAAQAVNEELASFCKHLDR